MNRLQAGRAKATFGHIDNTFKGEIISRLGDQPQIGNRVANFGSFIKPGANHTVWQTNGNKALFKFPRLKPCPHQNRDLR